MLLWCQGVFLCPLGEPDLEDEASVFDSPTIITRLRVTPTLLFRAPFVGQHDQANVVLDTPIAEGDEDDEEAGSQ